MNKLYVVLLIAVFAGSCTEDYIPRPRGFQRLELPAHQYQPVKANCGFEMEIPVYATLQPDSHPSAEPCWYNVVFPEFNATLHLSYKTFPNRESLYRLMEDSRLLAYKHTVKADEIYEVMIRNNHISGMLYELSGNTATNFQFYATDTVHHFLRGSLYFNSKTHTDSVAPALEHLKVDVMHMLESLRWNGH